MTSTTFPQNDASAAAPGAMPLAIEIEFDRSSLPAGGEGLARLVVRVPHAEQAAAGPRKGLAFAAVMDTSGSMDEAAGGPDGSPMSAGNANAMIGLGGYMGGRNGHGGPNSKMERCKSALREAIALLGDEDMASLTAFSSMAKTLFPMAPMTEPNKAKFIAAIDKLKADGGTALHAGWVLGGKEAAKGLDRKLLCRVGLFTDGQASDGERNPETLAAHAAKLAELGVSTTCFGVGASFNEDLLCAMADAGEGNFRYIPDAMLATAAATDEVNGLGAAAGRRAKLRVTGVEGVDTIEILNALPLADGGWSKLPTLVSGRPIEVVAKFKVAPGAASARLQAEVIWEDRDGISQIQQNEAGAPVVEPDAALALAQNPEVAGAAAALMAAKAKDDMTQFISQGNFAGAASTLADTRAMLSASAMGYSGLGAEMDSLDALTISISSGDMVGTRKMAKFQSYSRSVNQTVTAPVPATQPQATKTPAPGDAAP